MNQWLSRGLHQHASSLVLVLINIQCHPKAQTLLMAFTRLLMSECTAFCLCEHVELGLLSVGPASYPEKRTYLF